MMRGFDHEISQHRCVRDIPTLLELDETAPNSYRSRFNHPNAYRSLFGGQIVARALVAADRTVSIDRRVHSLHFYFLRAGTDQFPVDYLVEPIRDGRRFSTRRVVATQDGEPIFTMDCSYRSPVEGFSHYWPSTVAFEPEEAMDPDVSEHLLSLENQRYAAVFKGHYPIEIRLPNTVGFLERAPSAKRHYWLRAPGAERCTDASVQREIFAFMSDFMLAGVPASPHTVALPGPHLFVASLDHNIWFHRDMRCDDWLLFETDGPNAEQGVNLARAMVYNRTGELVATLMQEALQYPMAPPGS